MSYHTPPGIPVKEYVLREPGVLLQEPTPQYLENPFAPPGHEIDVVWKSPLPVPYAQQFNEGGSSSEKLFRCGLVWRRYVFYDEEMNRKRFQYGYTLGKHPEHPQEEDIDAWYERYKMAQFVKGLDLAVPEQDDTEEDEPKNPSRTLTPEEVEQERQRDRERRKRKQKAAVQNYVNKNYLMYMYTFTFALERNDRVKGLRFVLSEEEQRDREHVEKAWNTRLTYMRRKLRERGIDFRFVKVLEKHESDHTDPRKRGTYHIHLATDREIDKHVLQQWWGYGVVWVDNFNKSKQRRHGKTVNVQREGAVKDPGWYMAKYIDKDFDDAEAHGKRAYSPSQNLRKPIPDRDEEENTNTLQTPIRGFSAFDKRKIREIDPTLIDKIARLHHADDVKMFDTLFPIEFLRYDEEGGQETVKMYVQIEYYNFRSLMHTVSNP